MKQYRLTDEQFNRIKEASKPVPYMLGSGGRQLFPSTQERANDAWKAIAQEHGCKWDTISPTGNDPMNFMAEPLLTDSAEVKIPA